MAPPGAVPCGGTRYPGTLLGSTVSTRKNQAVVLILLQTCHRDELLIEAYKTQCLRQKETRIKIMFFQMWTFSMASGQVVSNIASRGIISVWMSLVFLKSFKEVHPLLPMVALFFFLMTVGCLLGACLADPGIIPRREVAKKGWVIGYSKSAS